MLKIDLVQTWATRRGAKVEVVAPEGADNDKVIESKIP